MKRLFESDALIIATLLAVVGLYHLATNQDVQAGLDRLADRFGHSERNIPADSVTDPLAVKLDSDRPGSDSQAVFPAVTSAGNGTSAEDAPNLQMRYILLEQPSVNRYSECVNRRNACAH